MSIKTNEFGEVISVNGLTTGQHLGAPMQDAVAEKPEDNQVYATELSTVTRNSNVNEDEQPSGNASSQKRELLLDITVVEPKDNVTYQNSEFTAEELEIITALIDPSTEFEVEVVYKAYGTPYTSCLSSRDATRTSEIVGINKLDGIMGGENKFKCSINGSPQIVVKSAYATLSGFKVYKIV